MVPCVGVSGSKVNPAAKYPRSNVPVPYRKHEFLFGPRAPCLRCLSRSGMRKRGTCRQSGLTDIPLPFTRTLPGGSRSYVDSSPHTQPRRRRGDVWKAVLVFSHDTKHSRHQLRSTVQNSFPYYRERPSVAGRSRTVIAAMHVLTRFGAAKTGGASRDQGRISVSEGPKGARNRFLTRRKCRFVPTGGPRSSITAPDTFLPLSWRSAIQT
jgi:hypothetical protein